MKNILITGNKGFIGRHLEKKLTLAGFCVYGIDLPEADITAETAFLHFKKIPFERIFHLAGNTYIPDSWIDPGRFYHNNITGTLRVLQFCKETSTALTFVSCYLYGRPQYLPVDEKHPVQPLNPYHHSKYLAEQMCLFYHEHFSFPVVIIRPFNIYGPGQRKDFLIPTIMRQLLNPALQRIEINDLNPKRDFLYVDDFIEALIETLSISNDLYNIGSGKSLSVKELITIVSKTIGKDKPIKEKGETRKDEIEDVVADISRICSATQWKPVISIKEGISLLYKKTYLNTGE
jgi:nucleoside-diphosphate-sugar epimerase